MNSKRRTGSVLAQRNSFQGGMNQDAPDSGLSQTQYTDALNAEPMQVDPTLVEMDSGTSFSGRRFKLSNVRGHDLFITLPDLPGRTEFTYTRELTFTFLNVDNAGQANDTSIQLTFNRNISPNVVVSAGGSSSLYGPAIVEAVEGLVLLGLNAVLTSEPGGPNSTNYYITITQILTGVDPIDLYTAADSFLDINGGAPEYTATISQIDVLVPGFPAQTNLTPIGWSFDATDLILLTTSESNITPSYSQPALHNVGQVWKIDISRYEEILSSYSPLSTSPYLKYNDRLDFSLRYQAEVRYVVESDSVKYALWTDNYNPPRTLNVARPGLIADSPGTLAFVPSLASGGGTFDFIGHGGGGLKVGARQYAVRYISFGGQPSQWHSFSRKINTTSDATGAAEVWTTTQGGQLTLNTTKSNIIRISNVDTAYSQIEIACLFYDTEAGLPTESYLVARTPITEPTFTFEHVSDLNVLGDITVDELQVGQQIITRAKSLVVTNGRAFLANYCQPESIDIIPTSAVTISPVIKRVIADDRCSTNHELTPPVWVGALNYSSLSLNTQPVTPANTGLPNPNFDSQQFSDNKGSLMDYYLRGYWRSETYRFGLQPIGFFGEEGPVSWIGDYTFPSLVDEPLMGPSGAETAPADTYFLRHLGARLSIDLSTLGADGAALWTKAAKFRVVRAVRGDRDKRIAAQGFGVPLYNILNQISGQVSTSSLVPDLWVNAISYPPPSLSYDSGRLVFYGPDTDLELYQPVNTDSLVKADTYTSGTILSEDNWVNFAVKADPGFYQIVHGIGQKFYQRDTRGSDYTLPIENSLLFEEGEEKSFSGVSVSMGITLGPIGIVQQRAKYGRGTAVQFTNPGITPSTELARPCAGFGTGVSTGRYENGRESAMTVFELHRNVTAQYGGASASAIEATEWQQTGYEFDVDPASMTQIYQIDVFGGDCFLGLYTRFLTDDWKRTDGGPPVLRSSFASPFPNRGLTGGSIPPIQTVNRVAYGSFGTVISFPCQSSGNFNLRFETRQPVDISAGGDQTNITNRVVDYWGGPGVFANFNTNRTFYAGYGLPIPDGMSITLGNPTESFSYNGVWSRQGTAAAGGASAPSSSMAASNCFPYSIIASRQRIPGDSVNQYAQILAAETQDLINPVYGQINHLVSLQELSASVMYALQDLAIARTYIGAVVQQVNDAAQIVQGTGTLFGPVTYLRNDTGTIHKWSVVEAPGRFYWIDAVNKAHMVFGNGTGVQRISEQRGMTSWFNSRLNGLSLLDNPILMGGIHGAYDDEFGNLYTTVRRPSQVMVYALSSVAETNFTVLGLMVEGRQVLSGPINVTGAAADVRVAALGSALSMATNQSWSTAGTNLFAPSFERTGKVFGGLLIDGSPDNTITPILSANEFNSDDWTLVFNDRIDRYTSRYNFNDGSATTEIHPGMYMTIPGARLLSVSPLDLSRIYRHNRNPLRNSFYGQLTPAKTSVTIVLNMEAMDNKLPGFIQADMNGLWDTIEVLTENQRDAGGFERRFRATLAMADIFQARGNRWQGPIPRANQMWENGAWLPISQSVILRIRGEEVYIRLISQNQALRDLSLLDTYYVVSKRNN